MKKRIVLVVLAVFLALGSAGCKDKKETQTKETLNENKKISMEYGNVTVFDCDTCSYDTAVDSGVKTMSVDAIQKLNNNNCTIVYNDNNKISFINGKYTDYKVSNIQEAYNSLMAVQELLTLPMENIVPIKMMKEENVGTYYSFGLLEGDNYKSGWALHVITDSKQTVQGLGISYGDSEFSYNNGYSKNAPNYSSNQFFENLKEDTATAKDINGKEVTIPVMYNENLDTYYMGDLQRRIVVGIYEENLDAGAIYPFLESKDNTWDDPQAVTVLLDLIEVYDFFAEEFGIYSVDGSGIPIMFYMHKTYGENGSNADYSGITRDYAWFNISDEFVDNKSVLIHEYTHGIFDSNCMSSVYANDTGAINEGYADLFGIMIYTFLENKENVNWFGKYDTYKQDIPIDWYSDCPDKVTSWKYSMPVAVPEEINDFGAVHKNGALIVHLANGLEKNHGLTKEDQLKLWTTTLSFLLSDENYGALKQQLLLSAKLHDHTDWYEAIETEFLNLGFSDEIQTDYWKNTMDEGCGRLTIEAGEYEKMELYQALVVLENDNTAHVVSKLIDGSYSIILPANKYNVTIVCIDNITDNYYLLKKPLSIEIKEGENTIIEAQPEENFRQSQ